MYAALADRMGVPVTAFKNWYTEERKAKGHSGNFHVSPTSKGKPHAVEVRTLLPLTLRGKAPSATYIPGAKGEYMEEDTPSKTEIDPLWSDIESITMCAFDLEGQEFMGVTPTRTHSALDSGGAES